MLELLLFRFVVHLLTEAVKDDNPLFNQTGSVSLKKVGTVPEKQDFLRNMYLLFCDGYGVKKRLLNNSSEEYKELDGEMIRYSEHLTLME